MQASTLEERVPEFGYRIALEKEGQADGQHIACGNEQYSKYGIAEGFIGIKSEIEDQDSDFGESNSRTIHDRSSGAPLSTM